jgi:hypothetical protein
MVDLLAVLLHTTHTHWHGRTPQLTLHLLSLLLSSTTLQSCKPAAKMTLAVAAIAAAM